MKCWKTILIWFIPLVLALMSLGIGRFEVDFVTVVKILASHVFPSEQTWTQMEYNVVTTVRLPRIILALLVGAGLSISGAAFQGMFANPLVSADILGVAAGAGKTTLLKCITGLNDWKKVAHLLTVSRSKAFRKRSYGSALVMYRRRIKSFSDFPLRSLS